MVLLSYYKDSAEMTAEFPWGGGQGEKKTHQETHVYMI